MNKEAYCSFEVAKLLKEKGFTEECEYFYDWYKESESYHICSNGGTCNDKRYPDEYSMPSHRMAIAWLKEVYNIFIFVRPYSDTSYYFSLCYNDKYYKNPLKKNFPSCEEAVEAGLKYVLEKLL